VIDALKTYGDHAKAAYVLYSGFAASGSKEVVIKDAVMQDVVDR
jgi:hypothetical protein